MNLTAPCPPPPPPYKGKFPTGGPVNRKPLWQFLIDFKRQAYASMQLILHHIEPHPSQYKKNALFLRVRWGGDTGYYSGGTDNYILISETFSFSSFLFRQEGSARRKGIKKNEEKG